MRVTPEELAAYADGELEGAEAARVLLAVAASPELMRTAQRYRALRERIGAEFGPNLDQEMPERLAALLRPPDDGAERLPKRGADPSPRIAGAARLRQAGMARSKQAVASDRGRTSPRRGWLVLPVLAGALALAGFLPGGSARELSGTSEERRVAKESGTAPARIVMSFQAADGAECRAFDSPSLDGIACREGARWKLIERVSDGGDAALLERAREMVTAPK